jgi:hypothetical protein
VVITIIIIFFFTFFFFTVYTGILKQQQLLLHITSAFLAASQIACNNFITILIQEDQVTYGKGTGIPG